MPIFSLRLTVFGLATLVYLLTTSVVAHAQLSVSHAIIDMASSHTERIVKLSNNGPIPMRVAIALEKVLQPENTVDGAEVTVPAPADVVQVHPSSVTLNAHETAAFTIKHTPRFLPKDEVYRVSVQPRSIALKNGSKTTAASANTGMNISLNYSLLLFVRPDNSDAMVRLKHFKKGLLLVNDGNTNVRLTSNSICDAFGRECMALPNKRIYAQQSWHLPLPEGFDSGNSVVNTIQSYRGESQQVSYQIVTSVASR